MLPVRQTVVRQNIKTLIFNQESKTNPIQALFFHATFHWRGSVTSHGVLSADQAGIPAAPAVVITEP